MLFTALGAGTPLVLSAVGGFPEVAAEGRRSSSRPATRRRCARRSRGCSATRPRASASPAAARGAAAERYGWDAIARAAPRPLCEARRDEAARARLAFWGSAGALAYAQARLPAAPGRARAGPPPARARRPATTAPPDAEPSISLIVAAHREADVIAARSRTRSRSTGRASASRSSSPATARPTTPRRAPAPRAPTASSSCRGAARSAPRTPAVAERARRASLAFSDANALWEPGALRALAARFADPEVGYVCGQVRFVVRRRHATRRACTGATRWRSARSSPTSPRSRPATARSTPCARRPTSRVDPVMGHDLTLPFTLVKRGWRAVYEPGARASEKMVPTIEGEFARKRRMMSHMWPIVLRGGLLSPRGYPPLYALMIASHRVLRYVGPFLHVVALAASIALARRRRAPDRRAPRSRRRPRCSAPPRGRPRALAAAARRALLRPHDGVDRRRARGTTCATARRRGGRRRRARAEGRAAAPGGYGMNSGPLSVNALRKSRMTAID